MRTSPLSKEVKRVDAEIKGTVLADLSLTGGTLVSDGCGNVKNKPLLKFVMVCTAGEVLLTVLTLLEKINQDSLSQIVL